MSIKKYGLASFLVLLATSASSFAATNSSYGLNVDGLLGIDLITGGGSSSTTNVGYGARVGYSVDPSIEVGVSLTTSSNSTTVNGFSNSASLGLLLADLNYHLPEQWNPLYFGIRLGLGLSSGSTTIPGAPDPGSSTNLAYGFVGGYDHSLGNNITIGPRVAYTITQYTPGNIGDFQAQAALKYFF